MIRLDVWTMEGILNGKMHSILAFRKNKLFTTQHRFIAQFRGDYRELRNALRAMPRKEKHEVVKK
jgi:hypothetical protein